MSPTITSKRATTITTMLKLLYLPGISKDEEMNVLLGLEKDKVTNKKKEISTTKPKITKRKSMWTNKQEKHQKRLKKYLKLETIKVNDI